MSILRRFVVGRFQIDEPTDGHRKLLGGLRSGDVVFIGSANATISKKNPLTAEARKIMLSEQYPHVQFFVIKDHPSDKVWTTNLDKYLELIDPTAIWLGLSGEDGFGPIYKASNGSWPVQIFKGGKLSESTKARDVIGQTQEIKTISHRRAVIWATQQLRDHMIHTVDIVCTTSHNKVLVVAKFNEQYWRFPGGFVDHTDISLEAAAIRELYEEVGPIEVSPLKYWKSFPIDDWRYKSNNRIMTSVFRGTYIFGFPEANSDVAKAAFMPIDSVMVVKEHEKILEALKDEPNFVN